MPTLDELLARVYRHYPRGIDPEDARHRDSEESRRLMCVRQAAAKSCEWNFYDIPDDLRHLPSTRGTAVVFHNRDELECARRYVARDQSVAGTAAQSCQDDDEQRCHAKM